MPKTKNVGTKKNALFNIYGARKTSNKKYASITLIKDGKDGNPVYINSLINIVDKDKKVHGVIKGENLIITIPMLKPTTSKKDEDDKDDEDDEDDEDVEDLPF